MSTKYSTGVRFNHHMGVLESISFTGEGVGAALYVIAFVTGQWALGIVGILLVFGAVVALLNHLGVPLRSWRAITRVATSWVSRGTSMIGAFLAAATASILALYIAPLQALQPVLALLAVVFAIPVMIYAGMLLRSMRALRLWRGSFVPLSFIAHSIATACVLAWAVMHLLGDAALPGWLQPLALVSLVAAAVLSTMHLMLVERSVGVSASLERLLKGDLRNGLFIGAGLAGFIVPLVALVVWSGGAPAALLVLVAAARLYGDFAYRNAIVIAAAYEPVMPFESHRTHPAETPVGKARA
jgi:DMSO reductase anchor subunit